MSDIMLYGVLRMPYEMAMSNEISRLQFYQRAQEAADRLEKCETTPNTTSIQAASIDTDPYFCKLLSRIAEFGFTGEHDKALIAYIDTKLAQAYKKGQQDTAGPVLNSVFERAEKAEARLAAIQRGVEGLDRYDQGWDGIMLDPDGGFIDRDGVLAILAPQGQASDTSGQPG